MVEKLGLRPWKNSFWVFLACCCAATAQEPRAQEPVAGIAKLFETYRIVMLGEIHGCRQQWDLLKRLAADPGFSSRVNDIVMEFGNARFQGIVDRYVNGGDVPLAQLEGAWRDVVGALGPVSPVYGEFYAAVRAANRNLPRDHRLRILLGDPPIDWSRVATKEDIAPFLPFRDEFYAQVVRQEVIARKRKALLIMGGGHFGRRAGRPGLIENELLMALVKPYVILAGSNVVGGFDDLDPKLEPLPAPSLIELKGSGLGAREQMSDGFLYLGPRDHITVVKNRRSDLVGTPYGREVERRLKILFDQPPDFLPQPGDSQEQPAFSRTPAPPPPLPAIPKPRP